MYNRSAWAQHIGIISKYLCDAVGHDVDSSLGRQCLDMARSHLGMAERAASTPQENTVTSHMATALEALQPKKIGAST